VTARRRRKDAGGIYGYLFGVKKVSMAGDAKSGVKSVKCDCELYF
jgi:hypothetical protein